MWKVAKWYTQFGLMAGTVFRDVLIDLEREGLKTEATAVRGESSPVSACSVQVKWLLRHCEAQDWLAAGGHVG